MNFLLKKIIQFNKKKFFLSPLTTTTNIHNGFKHNNLFSQISLSSSIIKIQTQKHNLKINQIITIKQKKKRKERKDISHLTHLGCVGEEDKRRRSGRHGLAQWMPILRQLVSFDQRWSKQDLSLVLSLCLFLHFLSQRELENVLKSSRKRKRESWRKKERERF